MSLNLLTRRESVLAAIAEHDALGRQPFLDRYGYAPSRAYYIEHEGARYDSKAIAGVAVGKEHPERGPLRAEEFSGGEATVRRKLASLGFKVVHAGGSARGFDSEAALLLMSETLGPPHRQTKYLAAWDLAGGAQLALQLSQESVRVWTEAEPPSDLGWTTTLYPPDKTRHGNLQANAPRLYLPNPAYLTHVRDADALRRFLAVGLPAGGPGAGLDRAALQQLREAFLSHATGFKSFGEPGATYVEQERAYKDELRARFLSDVAPLASSELSGEGGQRLGAAFHRLLSQPLSTIGKAQNLVPWQAVDRIKPGSPFAERFGINLAALLTGEGDARDRLDRFVEKVGEMLREAGASGPGDMARVLGSCALMLADPQSAVLVRYGLFDRAMRTLLHRRFPSHGDEPGRYRAALALAEEVREALTAWGWRPKDLMDVQGFLWVALMYGPAPDGETHVFRDALSAFLERLAQVRERKFGADEELKQLGERIVSALKAAPAVEARPNLLIEWSVGKGNWAGVPWIALMDRRETTTTQQGLYVVFLISEDLSEVHLTLNQGTTVLIDSLGQVAGGEQLRARAEAARARIKDLEQAGFALDNQVSLQGEGWRARSYQMGVIAHMTFPASDLPDDGALAAALEAALSAYDQLRAGLVEIEKDRPCWFVGAAWGGDDDQTSRFLAEGVWENGWEEGPTLDIVRQMRPGDRIAIKAAHTRKNDLPFPYPDGRAASVMRIKATGVITANPGDGRRVEVAWTPTGAPRDWYFYTNQATVWRVTAEKERARRLIAFAFDGEPQDYEWFLRENGMDEPSAVEVAAKPEPEAVEPYSIEDALNGLFMGEEELRRILRIWGGKKNLILQGPPGVGKSFIARRLAFTLMEEKAESRLAAVQFHQSYGYEDFIQGFRPTPTGGFALRDGVFLRFCRRALADPGQPYVFIIDEINRGNLSKIFGELMLLIEHDKRSPKWRTQLAYAAEGEPELWLPENLYILGMMNTADRSLSLVDYALRRRFAFVKLEPAFEAPGFAEQLAAAGVPEEVVSHICKSMAELNAAIAADTANLGPGFQIGHSFFVPGEGFAYEDGWLAQIVETEIQPLLSEYWFDDPKRSEAHCAKLLER
jgi:5-methylcytosine-specific restriction protein B